MGREKRKENTPVKVIHEPCETPSSAVIIVKHMPRLVPTYIRLS